jgi:hypothetical protein
MALISGILSPQRIRAAPRLAASSRACRGPFQACPGLKLGPFHTRNVWRSQFRGDRQFDGRPIVPQEGDDWGDGAN